MSGDGHGEALVHEERQAAEIRIRAERKAGELLKETEKHKAGRLKKNTPNHRDNSPYTKTLDKNGISTQTASRWQQLAEVPKEQFEEALRDKTIPTTRRNTMGKRMSKNPTLADEIRDETEIVLGIAQQLEALARVLTYVTTEGDEQDPPIITPEDFVCIMQVFHEKLVSIEDLAGGVEAAVERGGEPASMQAV